MSDKAILISVKPKYSSLIKNGEKKVELRKRVPQNVLGKRIYVYSTCPDCEVIGFFYASSVESLPVKELWENVRQLAGICEDDFNQYFIDKNEGNAIYFDDFTCLENPVSLQDLRERNPAFVPPQNYYYVTPDMFEEVIS